MKRNSRRKTQAAVDLGPCVKQVIQLICVNLEEGEANLQLQILRLERSRLLRELHVELERSKLDRNKLLKELQAQKMLKERDNTR